jgi:rod shape-determining protein MreD
MRSFLLYLTAGLAGALLQSSVFPLFLPTALRPNLLLILVLYLGLSENLGRAVMVTLLLGGIQDSFCGTSLGLYTSVDLALLLLVRLLSEHLNTESPPLLLLLIAGGTLVETLLVGFCLATFAEAGPVMGILVAALPQQLLANLLAAGGLLWLCLRFQPLLGARAGLAGLIYQSKRHGS